MVSSVLSASNPRQIQFNVKYVINGILFALRYEDFGDDDGLSTTTTTKKV